MKIRDLGFVFPRPLNDDDRKLENFSRVFFSLANTWLNGAAEHEDFQKINFIVNPKIEGYSNHITMKTLSYVVRFDSTKVAKLPISQRKAAILDVVEKSILECFSDYNIPKYIFIGYKKFVHLKGYKNTFTGKKVTIKPSTILMLCEQTPIDSRLYLILNSNFVEKRYFIEKMSTDEFIFMNYLDRPKILNDNEVKVKVKDGFRSFLLTPDRFLLKDDHAK